MASFMKVAAALAAAEGVNSCLFFTRVYTSQGMLMFERCVGIAAVGWSASDFSSLVCFLQVHGDTRVMCVCFHGLVAGVAYDVRRLRLP